jgi:hypothetical protein
MAQTQLCHTRIGAQCKCERIDIRILSQKRIRIKRKKNRFAHAQRHFANGHVRRFARRRECGQGGPNFGTRLNAKLHTSLFVASQRRRDIGDVAGRRRCCGSGVAASVRIVAKEKSASGALSPRLFHLLFLWRHWFEHCVGARSRHRFVSRSVCCCHMRASSLRFSKSRWLYHASVISNIAPTNGPMHSNTGASHEFGGGSTTGTGSVGTATRKSTQSPHRVDTIHALCSPSSGQSKQLSAPSAHEFSGQLNEQVVSNWSDLSVGTEPERRLPYKYSSCKRVNWFGGV